MSRMFRSHLAAFTAWVKEQSNFRALDVDFNAMVAEPDPIVAEIDRFLGGSLDIEAMVRIPSQPGLYRNRAS